MTASFELVIHHRYTTGSSADLSGNDNHGHRSAGVGTAAASPATAEAGTETPLPADPDGFAFDGQSTRVIVLPSPSLTDFRGVRVRARVRPDSFEDRRTIVEGYLAFSFFFDADGALTGSVYTGTQWHEITTPPSLVPPGSWVDVAFTYDGRDTTSLSLDGEVVTTHLAALGSVNSVAWPYGLNIGAWPDQDAGLFNGRIAELWVWRLRR